MTGAGTAVATAPVVNTGLVSAVVGRTIAVGTVSAKTLPSDRCGDAGCARLRERLRVLLRAELGRTVALLTLANKCDARGLLIGTDEGLTCALGTCAGEFFYDWTLRCNSCRSSAGRS